MSKKHLVHGALLPTQNLPTKLSDSLITMPEKKERKHQSIVQERLSASTTICYKNLKELASRVKKVVLNDWSITCAESVVRIWKVDVPYVIPTYDIQIDDSLGFTLIVYGWFLPDDHMIYKSTKHSLRNITV